MQSKKLLTFASILGIGFFYLALNSFSGGITGQSTTGCAGATCHATSGTGTTINLTGIPATGYVPNTTYSLTFTVSNPTKAKAGFNISVSDGLFSAPPPGLSLNGLLEIYHNTPKNAVSGITSWNFNWISPNAGTSSVTFSAAGNAVNGTGNASGDDYKAGTFTFNEAVAAPFAPFVQAVTASNITSTGAKIDGNITANNASTSVVVQYGLSNSYGTNVVTTPATVVGSTPVAVTQTLTGLTPGTTYHYRIRAINSVDSSFSNDQIFTTQNAASVEDVEKLPFSIYPNPTNGNLFFKADINIDNLQCSAMDMSGAKHALTPIKKGIEYLIPTHHLSTGTYILQVEMKGKTYPFLFSKTK